MISEIVLRIGIKAVRRVLLGVVSVMVPNLTLVHVSSAMATHKGKVLLLEEWA